jgi:plasmid replication initiation protein
MDNENDNENNEITWIVKKSNDLIEKARYDLSITQQKLILFVIKEIRTDDTDFKTYDVFVSELIEATKSSDWLYFKLKQEAKDILKKPLLIRTDDGGWVALNWFSSIRYLPGKGILRLRFDPALKPYLLQLKERFTEYDLRNVFPMRSTYSPRIYELLKQYQQFGKRYFDLEEFKQLLAIDTKIAYSSYGLIKQHIISTAIKEINQHTDLQITDFKEKKISRKVVGFTFYFTLKENIREGTATAISNSEPAKEILTKETPSEAPSKPPEIPSETISEPVKEALANIVQAPSNDSEMQERRLNYLYSQIPENQRKPDIKDILKQFLDLPDEKILSNIKYTIKKNPENFAGYLLRALQNDYAKEEREQEKPSQEEKKRLKAEWWRNKIDEAISIMPPEEKQELLHFIDVMVLHKEIEDTPEAREKAFRNLVKQELEIEGLKCPYDTD